MAGLTRKRMILGRLIDRAEVVGRGYGAAVRRCGATGAISSSLLWRKTTKKPKSLRLAPGAEKRLKIKEKPC